MQRGPEPGSAGPSLFGCGHSPSAPRAPTLPGPAESWRPCCSGLSSLLRFRTAPGVSAGCKTATGGSPWAVHGGWCLVEGHCREPGGKLVAAEEIKALVFVAFWFSRVPQQLRICYHPSNLLWLLAESRVLPQVEDQLCPFPRAPVPERATWPQPTCPRMGRRHLQASISSVQKSTSPRWEGGCVLGAESDRYLPRSSSAWQGPTSAPHREITAAAAAAPLPSADTAHSLCQMPS